VDFEVREIEGMRMLGVGGRLKEIGELWHRCGEGFEAGWLPTLTEGVSSLGFVRVEPDGQLRYFAGVPTDPRAVAPPREAEGFELLDIPGGRYAFVHHEGPTERIHDLQVALQAAARAADESPDGTELELYHPASDPPDAVVDIGARLEG
jgi:predicted transcriptional regulator YdeE